MINLNRMGPHYPTGKQVCPASYHNLKLCRKKEIKKVYRVYNHRCRVLAQKIAILCCRAKWAANIPLLNFRWKKYYLICSWGHNIYHGVKPMNIWYQTYYHLITWTQVKTPFKGVTKIWTKMTCLTHFVNVVENSYNMPPLEVLSFCIHLMSVTGWKFTCTWACNEYVTHYGIEFLVIWVAA